MSTLLLMRHGKSDWNTAAGSDHDRPLAPRGVRSARLMGRMLTNLGLAPELVISSTAMRARTTAHLAREAGRWDVDVKLERGFYGGSPSDVLRLVADAAPPITRLMLVGHEPTWSGLVGMLTGEWVAVKTGTVAVIEVPAPWSSLPDAAGELMAIHHPRDYFDSEWDTDR
jgi:phosphohistidine phosphatase